jgi:hypothetical protein
MQHKETSEAPAQAPDGGLGHNGAASEVPGMAGQALDQLTELAAISWSVSETYGEQIKLTGELAKTEWQLSGRSLVVAAALTVCFGAGLMLLWSGVLLVLGYLLFQLTASLALTAGALFLLQLSLLLWCWRSLNYVLTQIGFSQTWQQVKRLFSPASAGATSAGAHSADK